MYETSHQSRFDAQYWMPGAGALGRRRGRVWGGRREEGSGWGARVYLWRIHFDVWQKFKNKINKTTKKRIIQAHNLKINSVKRKFSAPLISTPTLALSFFRSVYFSTLSAASSHIWSHICKKDVLVAPSRSICLRACQFISSYGI